MEDKITAIVTLELLGRPASHLKKALEEHIGKMDGEKGVSVIKKDIKEVKEVQKNVFSTFAELEVECLGMRELLIVAFNYMPSHVEIIKPGNLKMNSFEFNEMINTVIRRLHQYDEIAKRMIFERNVFYKQLEDAGIKPGVERVEDETKKKK